MSKDLAVIEEEFPTVKERVAELRSMLANNPENSDADEDQSSSVSGANMVDMSLEAEIHRANRGPVRVRPCLSILNAISYQSCSAPIP